MSDVDDDAYDYFNFGSQLIAPFVQFLIYHFLMKLCVVACMKWIAAWNDMSCVLSHAWQFVVAFDDGNYYSVDNLY